MRSLGAPTQCESPSSRHFVFDRPLDELVEADPFRCGRLYGARMQVRVDPCVEAPRKMAVRLDPVFRANFEKRR